MIEFIDSQKLIYKQLLNKRIKYVEEFQNEFAGIQEFAQKLIDEDLVDYENKNDLEKIIEMGDVYLDKPYINRNET